jgi:large subunit ribosomal protein L18
MISNKITEIRAQRRRLRVRKRLHGTPLKPRLVVFRSNKQIYVQLVDDDHGRVLGGNSSLSPQVKSQIKPGMKKVEISKLVGQALAQKAQSLGITQAVFDRSFYLYHGRVKALADGAREGGLKF